MTKTRTIRSTPTTCLLDLLDPLNPRAPPRWQEHTTNEDDYHRVPRHQDSSQWQDWDDWGKWQAPTSHDHSSWPSTKQAIPTLQPINTLPGKNLSAAPHSRPLTAFSTSAQPHQRSKKRHPRSDTGDQSRGPSSLPAGHMQISLHDDSKTEWIKWVKFGSNHRDRMKAASELTEEEQPKSNASIDIDQFQAGSNHFPSICRSKNPSGNRQESNQLDLQRPLAT